MPVLLEVSGGATSPHHISPAGSDIPQPGLVPHTPAAVQSDQGVVKTSPGGLTELLYSGRLACILNQNKIRDKNHF